MELGLPSDEVVIARLRRSMRYRRWIGAGVVLLGIGSVVLVEHFLGNTRAMLVRGLSYDPNPTKQQLQEKALGTSYLLGFAFGFQTAGMYFAAAGLLAAGIRLIMPNRKDKLLLKCWDAQHSEFPANVEATVEHPAIGR
jgi:hypothetical protein